MNMIEMQAKIESLGKEIASVQSDAKVANEKLVAVIAENETLKAEKIAIEASVADLKSKLEDAAKSVSEASSKANEAAKVAMESVAAQVTAPVASDAAKTEEVDHVKEYQKLHSQDHKKAAAYYAKHLKQN